MEMIGIQYVVAFALALTNVFKAYVPAKAVPFIAIIVTIAFNVLNATIFGGDILLAGREAFISGGITAGLFVSGDAIRTTAKTGIRVNRL